MRQKKSTRQLKKLQKWVVPLLLILVAIAIFLVTSFIKGESQLTLTGDVYQYFGEERFGYGDDTTLIMGEYGIVFQNGEEQNTADSSPIYYEEEKSLILPNAMSWISGETGKETYIPAYSTLVCGTDGVVRLTEDNTILKSGALYDGKGNFLLLDTATLTWGGETMSISPLSFISVTKNTTRVYDYATETFSMENTIYSDSKFDSVLGYAINMYTGIYSDDGGNRRLLMADPSALLS